MKCPGCGNEYESLGGHWRYNGDHRPEISEHQHEIITGLVMGDGTAERPNGGQVRIRTNMINFRYLEYLDNKMGIFGTGIVLRRTADEASLQARNSNSVVNGGCNFSNIYSWRTMRHPEFERYREWYSSGKKVFPNIELTPTIFKHWYVCDGTFNGGKIDIGIHNESERTENIQQIFDGSEIPSPYFYKFDDNRYSDGGGCKIRFDRGKTKRIFDIIGEEPLPGFEHKWPEQ